MGNRLWEYRTTPTAESELQAAFCMVDGVFHFIQCNSEGGLALHIIEESSSLPEMDLKSAIEMEFKTPFALLPKVFHETGIPGYTGITGNVSLDENTVLCSGISGTQAQVHVALPLYRHAKSIAEKSKNLVYCYAQNAYCFVFVFKNEICELANIYPAVNESEVMYFCMAGAKKSGLDVRQIDFVLLGNNTKTITAAFERFGIAIQPAPIELPYKLGEYPPYPAESFLLYQYLTCALPVEN
ncbi:MAG: DUF3822 family protein [Bacteroidia bacterium]|jgi:hypothetical protein|nr:DUF3822 family protein [Bacteroidia bacterium]